MAKKVGRPSTITAEQIKRAQEMKAQGMKMPAICAELKKSDPTIRKMLKMPLPVEQ